MLKKIFISSLLIICASLFFVCNDAILSTKGTIFKCVWILTNEWYVMYVVVYVMCVTYSMHIKCGVFSSVHNFYDLMLHHVCKCKK